MVLDSDSPKEQSVRVVVRVRPMNEKENKANTLPVTLIRGVGQRQIRQVYHFDSVYTSYSTQCEVFETVRPLVHEVMQGFEATVFAYGQTGTGKTHTMEGEIVCEEKKGIIPRAVEAIFESLGEKGKYVSSAVSASYLEIYNEELSDLLTEARCGEMWGDAADERGVYNGRSSHADGAPKLSLVEDKGDGKRRGKGVYAHNLSEHEVCSAADVLGLIARAQERRRVGETRMNKHSSRSHCVFTLTRKNINQSLLTLGRVISTLRDAGGKDKARIPYRDSKLTRLLQESLGGRCKTVVIATLSPSQLAVEESASTLSYVEKAQGITNKPVATSFLKYLEEQAAEAEAALARKHTQQAEIVARAEEAEAARDTAVADLAAMTAEAERLRSALDETEAERRGLAY
ncbi:hypothetical protein EMIHUDRAFT_249760, partial [Emiliania huxleyi CCMP1516]|uniref:Kinesin motor domain-containing protein n=2 Tax=Emiliania huxleyi TaxID=2903 RepID=A0A0D3I5Y6_EMIH1